MQGQHTLTELLELVHSTQTFDYNVLDGMMAVTQLDLWGDDTCIEVHLIIEKGRVNGFSVLYEGHYGDILSSDQTQRVLEAVQCV